jgi:tRNA A37 methylthiotransferase MiaB
MKKVYIYNEPQACRRRALDAEKIYRYFLKNNFEMKDSPKDADLIVYITCAAVSQTANICLDKIKYFQKYKAQLLIMGCLPSVEKEKLSSMFNGKKIDTKEISKIDSLFPNNRYKFSELDDANILYFNLDKTTISGTIKIILHRIYPLEELYKYLKNHILKNLHDKKSFMYMASNKDQFHIRISWGCPNNCSYCTIKTSTGKFKSKPLEKCVEELKIGLKKGYKDIIITADNTGAYGIDKNSCLPELLKKFLQINGQYNLFIRGLDPRWVVKYHMDLMDILKQGKIVGLEIPIESGNERILRLMRRFSETNSMKRILKRIRSNFPELYLYTHIMAGFPTETTEEFKQTLEFVLDAGFDSGQIFPFSIRDITDAAKIKHRISQEEISKRMEISKKFLKKNGYKVIDIKKINALLFSKKR